MPSFLDGLHGTVATIVLCVMLFIDEAGVPLPLANNEVLLIFAGLLVASGGLAPLLFYPAAVIAMVLGSLTGYSWARRIGPTQLRRIAERIHAAKAYDGATRRMRNSDPWHITVARLIPGIRIYVTLVAGAAEVPLGTFMKASIPAILVWVAVMTTLGFIVGVPVEHFFTEVQKLAFSGGMFVILGIFGYRSATRARPARQDPVAGPFYGIARRDRYWLAFLVDAGLIASLVAGFDRITRFIGTRLSLPLTSQGSIWDLLTIVAVIALAYIFVSRRSQTGETAGERLFDASYVHFRRRRRQRDRQPVDESIPGDAPVTPHR